MVRNGFRNLPQYRLLLASCDGVAFWWGRAKAPCANSDLAFGWEGFLKLQPGKSGKSSAAQQCFARQMAVKQANSIVDDALDAVTSASETLFEGVSANSGFRSSL